MKSRIRKSISFFYIQLKGTNKIENSIRSVVNVDACGTTGREILFQANSREMIEAYKQAPYPHGTVMVSAFLTEDIFSILTHSKRQMMCSAQVSFYLIRILDSLCNMAI
jgi:hypothetical protein